ncbi:hypothetical protein ACOMHN_025312 [Nucella lapillus]
MSSYTVKKSKDTSAPGGEGTNKDKHRGRTVGRQTTIDAWSKELSPRNRHRSATPAKRPRSSNRTSPETADKHRRLDGRGSPPGAKEQHQPASPKGKGVILCECTTDECLSEGKRTCYAAHYCYSQYLEDTLSRGCIDKGSPLLCENRKPKGIDNWPFLYCCNDKDYCNKDVTPTLPLDSSRNQSEIVRLWMSFG